MAARARLRADVEAILSSLQRGVVPARPERERIDLKEEPGRRGAGGVLLPGDKQNPAAVELLARAVPCMANTPGGGALILGISDTGDLLGTDLDAEWLRHRVYERSDVAPAVEVQRVAGHRLLVLYVAESREPVEDPDRRIRWRVGDHCVPVDRSEWWLQKQGRAGLDVMAAVTQHSVEDVSPGAVLVARRYLADGDEDAPGGGSVSELLRRLGVLRPGGALTQAGVLAFCASPHSLISVARLDVPGGDVLNPPPDLSGLALLEQVAAVEGRLDAFNRARPLRRGLAEVPVRQLPPAAVREALLNGVVHRDWMQPDPVSITWYEHDNAIEVVSPGGFVGGITAQNVLTERHARYPALSDLFRGLRLVEKQGVGVDRMYREMIVLGHRPPLIVEQAGPRLRTRLTGGDPVVPVIDLVERITPVYRQRDHRVAIVIHELLHAPFLTMPAAATALQSTPSDAREALEVCADVHIGDVPLILPYKDVWLLSPAALDVLGAFGSRYAQLQRRGLLTYRRPKGSQAAVVVRQWLDQHDRITTGDYATLTGRTQPGALQILDRMVRDHLLVRGETMGRNAHYLLRPAEEVVHGEGERASGDVGGRG